MYAISEDGALYAWDSGGGLRWRRDLGWLPWDCLALGGDGTIYAGLKNADLVAINPHGNPLWRFRLDGLPAGDPAIAQEGTLYVGTAAGTLFALSHLGREQWRITLPGAITHAPAVDGAGTIYIVAGDRRLYALTQWGDFKWSLPLPAAPTALSIAAGGRVVVGTDSGEVIAVNGSGDIAWRHAFGARIAGVSTGPEQIVVASAAGPVVGLSDTGRQLWKTDTRHRLDAAPLLGETSVFEIAADGTILMLGPGRAIASSFAVGTPGSAVLSHDGTLYVGGRDWIVYAIQPADGGPGAWPQEGHDEGHSGRTEAAPPGDNEALLSMIPDYLYLQSLTAVGNRDTLMLLLLEIRKRIETHTIGKSTWYVVRLLERFSGEGVLNPVYRNKRVINDYPEVRAEAADLLGMIGSTSSRHVLVQGIGTEMDTFALAAEIAALGSLASDSDGSSSRAIAGAVSLAGMFPPDFRVAAAAVDALDRIAAYEGGMEEPAAIAALFAIYRGEFPQQIRARALSVLRRTRE
jgi:outer membrane protein assembly factor BamB